jgi:hypothetical protein
MSLNLFFLAGINNLKRYSYGITKTKKVDQIAQYGEHRTKKREKRRKKIQRQKNHNT